MIIKRIYLKNIRSFDEIEIFPSAGVNFIKGENGAGKSTIIESIGFCLFGTEFDDTIGNYLLQYGKDKGLIEITFTAKDGSEILVKKQISAKGTDFWRIYENGEDTPLTLLSKEVQSFISSAVGLSTMASPDWIFPEVIGIRQGNFRRPFEDAPSARIKTFDRIFGVQEYKKTYDKMSDSIKETDKRIDLVNKDIEYLAPQAGKTLETKENIAAKEKELGEAEKKLSSKEKQYRDFENLAKEWQLLDRRIEKILSEKARIKKEQEEYSELLVKDEERLKDYEKELLIISLEHENKSLELKKEEGIFETLANAQKTADSVNRFINEKVLSKQIAAQNAAKSAEEFNNELLAAKEDLRKEKEVLTLKEREKGITERLIALKARRNLIKEHEDKLKLGICPFYENEKCDKASNASVSLNTDLYLEIEKLIEEQAEINLKLKQLPDIEEARLRLKKAEKSYEDYLNRSNQLKNETIGEISRAASWDIAGKAKEILNAVDVKDGFIKDEIEDILKKSAYLNEAIKKGDDISADAFVASVNAFEVFIKKLYLFEQEKIEKARKEERTISDKKMRLTAESKALNGSIEKMRKTLLKNEESAKSIVTEEKDIENKKGELLKTEAAFGKIDFNNMAKQEYWQTKARESAMDLGESKSAVLFLKSEIKRMEEELKKAKEAQDKLKQLEDKKVNLEGAKRLLTDIRSVLKEAGPKIAAVFRVKVQSMADSMYKSVSKKAVNLEFTDNYDVLLIDNFGGKRRERYFRQLSGGEKMTAALAIRMSLLKSLGINFGFFDEPTDNLDVTRRENLSDAFKTLLSGFEQVFLVSHDDTFDSLTDEIIIL